MTYDDRFPNRKSPRIRHYDYSTPNYYFVTICTWNKRCLFGSSHHLNTYGKIAEQGIHEMVTHFPTIKINKFVVMPNHIHAIIVLNGNVNLPTIIGLYKSYVTKQIHQYEPTLKIWQSSFHDHVIRNQAAYEKIWLYIESNPDNWNMDCFFSQSIIDSWSAGS